jgi:hypothetical protein
MSPDQTDATLVAEPIVAWRTWNLAISRGTFTLLPVGDNRIPWPYGTHARARCTRHRRHRAPAADCTCGLHGSKAIPLLKRTRGPSVIGRAALWGRVVEHELGYRAEFAYPQRLALLCPVCFWQRGLEGRPPSVVAIPRRGLAVPLCEGHLGTTERCGFAIRRLEPARTVEAALMSAYAVDRLPA